MHFGPEQEGGRLSFDGRPFTISSLFSGIEKYQLEGSGFLLRGGAASTPSMQALIISTNRKHTHTQRACLIHSLWMDFKSKWNFERSFANKIHNRVDKQSCMEYLPTSFKKDYRCYGTTFDSSSAILYHLSNPVPSSSCESLCLMILILDPSRFKRDTCKKLGIPKSIMTFDKYLVRKIMLNFLFLNTFKNKNSQMKPE